MFNDVYVVNEAILRRIYESVSFFNLIQSQASGQMNFFPELWDLLEIFSLSLSC